MKANRHYYRPAMFMDEREYTQRMVGAVLTSSSITGVILTTLFVVFYIVS